METTTITKEAKTKAVAVDLTLVQIKSRRDVQLIINIIPLLMLRATNLIMPTLDLKTPLQDQQARCL